MSKPPIDDYRFRLRSGSVIQAGWLAQDLHFLTRSLRFLLQSQSANLRSETGLEAGEVGVLAVVSLNPGITQNDLAASLVLKKSAVTQVVQGLEKRGYLERRRSTNDRRANCLTLTEAGKALAETLRRKTLERQGDWFNDVPEVDRVAFFQVLFEIIAKMAEANAEISPVDRTL